MKRMLSFAVLLLVAACSQTPPPPNKTNKMPLEVGNNKALAAQYWQLSRPVKPRYPLLAKQQKLTGCTRFYVTITADGTASNIELVESFPAKVFDSESLAALRQWRWQATKENPEHVSIRQVVQLDFYDTQASNFTQAKAFCQG